MPPRPPSTQSSHKGPDQHALAPGACSVVLACAAVFALLPLAKLSLVLAYAALGDGLLSPSDRIHGSYINLNEREPPASWLTSLPMPLAVLFKRAVRYGNAEWNNAASALPSSTGDPPLNNTKTCACWRDDHAVSSGRQSALVIGPCGQVILGQHSGCFIFTSMYMGHASTRC